MCFDMRSHLRHYYGVKNNSKKDIQETSGKDVEGKVNN